METTDDYLGDLQEAVESFFGNGIRKYNLPYFQSMSWGIN